MARPSRSQASPKVVAASAAVFRQGRRVSPSSDRNTLVKPWQREAYRQVNLCGEARYAVMLFASLAARAEIGISQPQTLGGRADWVNSGPEVEALAQLAPTVRERRKLIRDYTLHRLIAGESYLIARPRVETDPEPESSDPIWEIVAVTEMRKVGDDWEVRHENGNFIKLIDGEHPVVRMWNPDPENRQEAWSPIRSLLPTLREIEWLTKHIFTQVRSRLMSAGVWFLPDNLTFPPPPPEAVEGGAEAIAAMNEAEQFMLSLAASSTEMLESEEVSFPSVVMAEATSLGSIDQSKLIQFWSEIDDKAMVLRTDAVRRFALGMDLPPEQVLGSSGLAISGSGGSAGSVNHWGEWANEEKTIAGHVEPALDDFVSLLTTAYLRSVVSGTSLVVGYDTAQMRMKQDRSKEALEWYDRGVLKASVALRETGFDPEVDQMDATEFKRWLLVKVAGGSATPEQVQESLRLLGVVLDLDVSVDSPNSPSQEPAPGQPGRNNPPSLKEHPYEGPPRVQHDHSPAPFGAQEAAAEVLVLRALEKAGNRLLNDGKRGKDRDRTTPPHLAHVVAGVQTQATGSDFDFSLSDTVFGDLSVAQREEKTRQMRDLCAELYNTGSPYAREALVARMKGVS